MKKKKDKKSTKQKLIDLLQHRIRLLEIEKQNYEQNPTLLNNVKMANIEIIQNDIAALKETLSKIITGSVPFFTGTLGNWVTSDYLCRVSWCLRLAFPQLLFRIHDIAVNHADSLLKNRDTS